MLCIYHLLSFRKRYADITLIILQIDEGQMDVMKSYKYMSTQIIHKLANGNNNRTIFVTVNIAKADI